MEEHETLDLQNIDEYLAESFEIVRKHLKNIHEDPVIPGIRPEELRERLGRDLPMDGTEIEQLFRELKKTISPACAKIGHPRFLAWIVTSPSHAGTIGEIINVGLNQVPLAFKGGPSATVLEEIVIHWFSRLFGYDEESGGVLVSGGTMANLTALAVAREARMPLAMRRGIQNLSSPLTLYVSDQGHVSIDRSAGMLGIGSDFVRKVPTDGRYKMKVDALERLIDEDTRKGLTPFCVVAQAGAVNTGSVDPIEAIASLCEAKGLWLHVDAAYGGGAVLSEMGRSLLEGIERADSIATDPHKWFFIPVEAGCALVKQRRLLYNTYKCKAGYLGDETSTDFMNYGFQLTRASRALKIWFAFKTYGFRKLARIIEQNMRLARELERLLQGDANWEISAPVELSIVCFRYLPDPDLDEAVLDDLQYRILSELEKSGKAFLTPAVLGGRARLRACFANHRTSASDVALLFELLNTVAGRIFQTLKP
jgi:aromatic-L-amino-acid/L-tryptophan decarboxylase